ncbi:Protein of unknown function [Modicisalibacter ilicicola DSM 19980]|uniref:DUF3750 domain-containing protein n=1 Tax=Modicisalibacter ilicicola DSM 19980 TaxID=1121942 RepID=A0A1M5EA08_9GAMM|nr:DUF3750 domain-containing protein [Halomonas ilicicola]SHF76016.1 Protein of unknown function [Halomonas ilicicola DSM 19980]
MMWSRGWRRALVAAGTALTLLLAGPMLMLTSPRVDLDSHWATADRSPTRLAPHPDRVRDAVVQVYAARAFNWRGAFAVHTWIATKVANAPYYQVHEVTRWYRSTTTTHRQSPDRAWYGSAPWLLADYRGEMAARMIPGIIAAVADYPGAMEYDVWPGPNSNTFVAWVVRRVPELRVHLPAIAVGKDYLPEGVLAKAPSGSGYQLSLGGVFGWVVALEEGIELNLLGLTLGIDLTYPALKLPGIGRVGFAEPVMGNGAG